MASGRAVEQIVAGTPSGEVVAFLSRADRLTPPRQSIDERLSRAGFALASHLFSAYDGTDTTSDSNVHAPTVIAILATQAAECAQAAAALSRRSPAPVAAGGWVLGGEADAVLYPVDGQAGPRTVWDMIAIGAEAAGMTAQDLPDMHAVVAHAEATVGEKPYPVLTVASVYRPKALLRAAAARHRHAVHTLAADEGLCSPHEQALVCGAAVAHVIKTDARPGPLTLLAAEVMIGAARLVPLPYAIS